ncbi:MAG: DUF5722 domain-containing protein [Pseudomonadota bacterium]
MRKPVFSVPLIVLLSFCPWGCDGEYSKTDTDADASGPDALPDRMDTMADPDAYADADGAGEIELVPDAAGDEADDMTVEDATPGEPDMDMPSDPDEEEAGPDPLPYPVRSDYRIKAIQPDTWPDMDEIAGNNTGGVAMNLVWAGWEPSVKTPPCDAESEEEYDGRCFRINANVDSAIRGWTERDVVVTAIVYGAPEWARVENTNCSPIAPGFEIFCAPDDSADYGRFAGMLARRYDGRRGNGRIADFVIHNEVNSNDWFDTGCGDGTPCNRDAWIRNYADNYIAAYDAVKAEQATAKVLAPFTHHFDTDYDRPSDDHPVLSVKTFVTGLDARLGSREWQIAYHPYAPNLFSPEFSVFDLPQCTYGNIGVIVGWLIAAFPSKPHAWEVHLTESGINSSSPQSSVDRQAAAVCDTLRNVLGTPYIANYIYHRMKDHPDEGGLQLGLALSDGTFKPAWPVWALANRIDLEEPLLDCGFEDLPYTRLRRGHDGAGHHWVSSRRLPAGYGEESMTGWLLLRNEEPGTTLLFECAVGEHNMLSFDPNCEGQQTMGPVGWIWDESASGRVALHRCVIGGGRDHFVSTDPGCEGQTFEMLLGYALDD